MACTGTEWAYPAYISAGDRNRSVSPSSAPGLHALAPCPHLHRVGPCSSPASTMGLDGLTPCPNLRPGWMGSPHAHSCADTMSDALGPTAPTLPRRL